MQEQFKLSGNEAFKAKNYPKAIEDYSRAIEVDPNCEAAAAIYSNRAASLTSLKRYPEALADAEACIRIRPDWLKGYFRKGAALEGLGQLDEAVKAFEGALTVDPKNEELQEKLTAARDAVRQRNDRIKPIQCRTALEAKTIGNSLFGQSKYDAAVEFYSRAIDLEKEDTLDKAACYANRAACYQQVHNFSGVISDATSAICIVPNHPKALLRRAIAYEALEKWQKALDDYNAVHAVSPGMQNVSQGILRCKRGLNSL
jgi:stress-induced-phosphoprotein 1